ncbi:ATP-binding protein [Paenibacillus sp. y28]|uniref:ATP-binding protein n=1 Tax=Paenibacillus sp. y28 TaxID=3129110 RepID=UPI00301963BA
MDEFWIGPPIHNMVLQSLFVLFSVVLYQFWAKEPGRLHSSGAKLRLAAIFAFSMTLCMLFSYPFDDWSMSLRLVPYIIGTLYGGYLIGAGLGLLYILLRITVSGLDNIEYFLLSYLLVTPFLFLCIKKFQRAGMKGRLKLILLLYSQITLAAMAVYGAIHFINPPQFSLVSLHTLLVNVLLFTAKMLCLLLVVYLLEALHEKSLLHEKLARKSNIFHWMIDKIPGGFILIDKDETITMSNPNGLRFLKSSLSAGEEESANPDHRHGEQAPQQHPLMHALQTGKVTSKGKLFMDGSVYQCDAAPIKSPETREIIGAVAYVLDMTEEEQNNLRLQEMTGQYLNEWKKQQQLIDAMPMLFVAYDRYGRVTQVNRTFKKFFNLEEEGEMIGKPIKEMMSRFVTSIDSDLFERALRGESIDKAVIQAGPYVLVYSTYPIRDVQSDHIIGAVAIGQDLTELHQLRLEIVNMERLNLVGQMAASITHEIRNPIAVIRGFIQLLMKQNDGEDLTYYRIILEEIDRANDIINDFLSLAQNRIVKKEERNLNDIIRLLMPLLLADANLRGLTVELRLADELPNLIVNEKEIKQLILNLARNGMEAMKDYGVLTISTRWEENQVIMSFQDTGCGIAPSHLEKLFAPFFTTKNKGTGLGLPVCLSIVEQHDGKITVESELDQGTVFICSFRISSAQLDRGEPAAAGGATKRNPDAAPSGAEP